MISSFETSPVNPLVRWIPDGTRMRIQTATRVSMLAGRVMSWLDSAEVVRNMTPDELEQNPLSPVAAVADQQEAERTAEERAAAWWEHMQAQRAADNEKLTSHTQEQLARATAEAERRLGTAACGIERCDSPKPCDDSQEALCEWSIGPAALAMTAEQRFANRSDKCPRRLVQIQRRKERPPVETLLSRGRLARIPAEYLDSFASPDYNPQPRIPLHAARAFQANRAQQFLILLGSNQCGKSYGAARWLWNQETGLFLSQDDLDLAMRPGDETGLERRAHSARFLVLDNLERSMSPAMRRRIEGLVIRYKQEGWRMVITSSMDPQRFMDCMKAEGAETGPAFARLNNGIAQGTVAMVECPKW